MELRTTLVEITLPAMRSRADIIRNGLGRRLISFPSLPVILAEVQQTERADNVCPFFISIFIFPGLGTMCILTELSQVEARQDCGRDFIKSDKSSLDPRNIFTPLRFIFMYLFYFFAQFPWSFTVLVENKWRVFKHP